MILKNFDSRDSSAPTQGQYTCILPSYSNILSSETAWRIKAKFYVKHLWNGGINVYINYLVHMTKMAAMPGKNPSKIFFSDSGGPISKKLGMKHQWLKYYNVYINHDPVMTFDLF